MAEAAGVFAVRQVPVLGEVAAGSPIEPCPVEDRIAVPGGLWSRPVFALRVRGDSMIDAGIRDGDYLIVERRAEAPNGRIVVAEVDGAVTVKRIVRDPGGRVVFRPAHPELAPFEVAPEAVRVLGVVVGIFRRHPPARERPAPARVTPLRGVAGS